ncbi:MAG: calcium-binding protein [Cyanobacteria bacterium CRU_2_1]|nr:calcium-binding protein [Cyanobacteria bacterium CRU_2_1]
MRDRIGNSIQKALNLNLPQANRRDSVNASDWDDVYRFTMRDRYGMTMLLSGVAKNASVGLQLFRLDKGVPKAISHKSFRELKPKDTRRYLTQVASITTGRTSQPWSQELNAGEYIVRVFHRKKGSRYSLSLTANSISTPSPDPNPSPNPNPSPLPTPSRPAPAPLPTPNPPPVLTNKFQYSGQPNGSTIKFEIDFLKNQDSDSRENFGLFRGAVLSGYDDGRDGNNGIPIIFQPGDLISFKFIDQDDNKDYTEYRAKLLTQDRSQALYIGIRVRADVADPDSLSSLENAMKIQGAVELFGRRSTDGLDLRTIDLSSLNNETSSYVLTPSEVNYTIQEGTGIGLGESANSGVIGNNLNNNLIGNSQDNELVGQDGNDFLDGKDGSDTLEGGNGNDTLTGGKGSDRLNGYGTTITDHSRFDTLTGGEDGDEFVLGGSWGVSYVEAGDGYAVIEDWQSTDTITVSGEERFYRLEVKNVIGGAASDTEIYYSNGNIFDRIAIIRDNTLTSFSNFNFIN